MFMVRDVSDSNLAEVRTFLEAHLDTSVFLLACLDRFGPVRGEHRDSGRYRCLEERDRVVAVASSTRRGHLLVQTGGREDLGPHILAAYQGDSTRIDGVVAEWNAAQSVWPALLARDGFTPNHQSKHIAYRIAMDGPPVATGEPGATGSVRLLGPDDFEIWYPMFSALESQEGAHIHGGREDVHGRFLTAPWRWWGAFEGDQLSAVGCLDLSAAGAGHLGGIYVRPEHRRKGLAKVVIGAIVRDSRESLRLSRLILFSREDNASAQRLYEGLGFVAAGRFGFLLGEWGTAS